MKKQGIALNGILLMALVMAISLSSPAAAQDLTWTAESNLQAAADVDAFKKALSDRFSAGLDKVNDLMKQASSAAEVYLSFKLGEMSGRTAEDVFARHRKNKGKGWGALAKSLGIKPGSAEFQNLKKGHDLYRSAPAGDSKTGKGKGKGKSKEKGKNKKDK